MPRAIIIRIECTDADDIPWVREECVPTVESLVETGTAIEVFSGQVSVTWEYQD